MNHRVLMAMLALILVGMAACAAHQMAAYKTQVNQVINQHFDATQCVETGRYHFRIKLDKHYNVVKIQSLRNTPHDNCADQIKRAIQLASPFPAAPSLVQYKVFEDGFGLNY